MPLRAWVKEQPNVTSARGGTRVHKDLRHRPQVAFVAVVVEPHTSLPVALMEEEEEEEAVAAVHLITDNGRNVTSQCLRHSIPLWRIE